MVTETAVYHWTIADQASPPQKVFDRHVSLAGAQIINYRVTPDEKWLVVVGISGNSAPGAFKIKGSIQLYSKDRSLSQSIEGHAAAFAELKLDGRQHPTKLFTFAARTATGAKVGTLSYMSVYNLTQGYSFTLSKSITKPPIPHFRRRLSTFTSPLRPSAISRSLCKPRRNTVLSIWSRSWVSST